MSNETRLPPPADNRDQRLSETLQAAVVMLAAGSEAAAAGAMQVEDDPEAAVLLASLCATVPPGTRTLRDRGLAGRRTFAVMWPDGRECVVSVRAGIATW